MVAEYGAVLTLTMPSDLEVVMTRVFDAPRRLLFEAWTRPEQVVQWWGPCGYTLPVCEMDVRPGGAYRFVMRGPDNRDYPMKGIYREIMPFERLVYTDGFDEEDGPSMEALMTLTFAEHDGRTELTIRALYGTVEDRDAILAMGMEEGMAEMLDRLAEHLETMS